MKKLLFILLVSIVCHAGLAFAAPVGKITGLTGQAYMRVKAGVPYTSLWSRVLLLLPAPGLKPGQRLG
jgi:hypothetical protein